MNKYYFTLGQAHSHTLPNGTKWDRHGLVQVNARTETQARELIVAKFGLKWCTSYTEQNISTEHYKNGVVFVFFYEAYAKALRDGGKVKVAEYGF